MERSTQDRPGEDVVVLAGVDELEPRGLLYVVEDDIPNFLIEEARPWQR